jgi:hypothetical protein
VGSRSRAAEALKLGVLLALPLDFDPVVLGERAADDAAEVAKPLIRALALEVREARAAVVDDLAPEVVDGPAPALLSESGFEGRQSYDSPGPWYGQAVRP